MSNRFGVLLCVIVWTSAIVCLRTSYIHPTIAFSTADVDIVVVVGGGGGVWVEGEGGGMETAVGGEGGEG